MRFSYSMLEPKIHVMERATCFGNPDLIGLLNRKIDLHANALLHASPKLLYQMLMIMMHDLETGTCTPCLCVLVISK